MLITLLRHSHTVGNLSSQYLGSTDMPLCEQGIDFARSVEPDPNVSKVYTSKLQRTSQTAKILYPNAEIIPVEALNEMDFGDFECKSYRELAGNPDYIAWLNSGCEDSCPNGEDKIAFVYRCTESFLQIINAEREMGTENLHFVVHGGTLMSIMSVLASPNRTYFDWHCVCCGGYLVKMDFEEEGPRPLKLVRIIRPAEGSGAI